MSLIPASCKTFGFMANDATKNITCICRSRYVVALNLYLSTVSFDPIMVAELRY